MHKLVKILSDDGGNKIHRPTWHVIITIDGSERTLCGGEVFGEGESNVVYKEKIVYKGVPCESCHAIVKWFKSIKL